MIIIVTGAEGFMGQHLIKRLRDLNHTIFPLDKKSGTSTSDINNLNKIVDADFIVHLGANCSSQISLREPATDFNDNAKGAFNVCEYSRTHGLIPIIFNSTMKVYPGEDGIIPPYGISKLVGEMYLKMYHKVYGVPYVINRPSSVYGPLQNGSDDGGWVTWFIKAKQENKLINLYGDGTQSRDILYIDDCISLLMDEIFNFEKYKNLDFDFGGGAENELSLNQLLDYLDYYHTKTMPKLPGDVQRFVVDNTRVSKINGWSPKVSWKQGVDKTLDFFNLNQQL